MKEEKRIFPFMYISLRKFMIMIAKNYIEFRFRLFWDTLYNAHFYTLSIVFTMQTIIAEGHAMTINRPYKNITFFCDKII